MAFSHGLCFGRRQLTILTPLPLFLTPRLCWPSQRLTSRLTCQLALSQMRSRTFLPRASSCSQHHPRNRVGIVFGDRLLDEAHRLSLFGPATQARQSQPTPPALVLETRGPPRVGLGHAHQSVAPPFFLWYRGSGEVIHRLARCQRAPSRRASVARTVSPQTRFSVKPCSKLTSAAISSVQRLVSLPNSLGERWSISFKAWAPCSSKAAWVLLGREEPARRASRPLSLKSWMASRTVCAPQPKFLAICGASSPLELAKSIWERRKTKASFERSPASSRSRSSLESLRMKIGGFMSITVTHKPKPALDMH